MKFFLKCTNRPTHVTHKIFDKNFAVVPKLKPVLTLNKPIYVGLAVLKLSKSLMYDFHYNFIKKRFDAELLFTDTDSFFFIKSNQNMLMKNFLSICLTLVTIQKIRNFLNQLIKKLLAK